MNNLFVPVKNILGIIKLTVAVHRTYCENICRPLNEKVELNAVKLASNLSHLQVRPMLDMFHDIVHTRSLQIIKCLLRKLFQSW